MAETTHNDPKATRRGVWGWLLQTGGTLIAIWVLLSGKFDALHLGLGVVGSLLIAASLYPPREGRPFPLMRFLAYVPWQLWQVVISNVRVTKVALSPRSKIRPSFIERDPMVRSEQAMTLLGCGITLTPGTLTVEMEAGHCLVHALDDVSASDIERDVMAKRVAAVFGEPLPTEGSAGERRDGEGG